jgi:hypothetical protein
MKRGMDYNELAMYFDKMVRRHDVNRVLAQARALYDQYLAAHASRDAVPAYYSEVLPSSSARHNAKC